MSRRKGRVCILGSAANSTNVELVQCWRRAGLDAVLVSAVEDLRPPSVVVGRLDVLPTLAGVEAGLLALLWLERRGVDVLNGAKSLLIVHDKLLTARQLEHVALPHPRTVALRGEGEVALRAPLVMKPRFGSWGRDVFLCREDAEVASTLAVIQRRPWFRRHGVLLQEFVASNESDLRLVVAGGKVVGAGRRVAAPGEWRTNISLGGSLVPAEPSSAAQALAVAAAAAVGADLVGVDLIALGEDTYLVLELNGAVEFDERYSLSAQGVYFDAADALGLRNRPPHRQKSVLWTSC